MFKGSSVQVVFLLEPFDGLLGVTDNVAKMGGPIVSDTSTDVGFTFGACPFLHNEQLAIDRRGDN
jgi:hypothetical protein